MSDNAETLKTPEQQKEDKFLEQVLEHFKQMNDEEQHETFVRAGIVNREGELTKPYGGDAEPEQN